jgi:hypothetical protein
MASSVLLKALRTQGVIVGVKKGSENSSKGRRGRERGRKIVGVVNGHQ